MAPALPEFVRCVADLCRLRGGPQHLPHSPGTLAGLVAAAIALDVLAGGLLGDAGDALAHSMLAAIVVLGLAWIELAIRGRAARYVQTATALAACGIVVSLAQMPVALLIEMPKDDAAVAALARNPLQVALRWLLLASLVWQVLVNAHILRQAVEIRRGIAIAHVVTWLIAYWALERLVFGPAG